MNIHIWFHRNLRSGVHCVLLLSSALGAIPVYATSTVQVTPSGGHPGLVATVSAAGFGDSEAVDVYFDTTDTLLLQTTTMGTFSGSLTLPANAQPGIHYVSAIGRTSGDTAQIAVDVSTPWYNWGFGPRGTSYNPFENTVNNTNVAQLSLLWTAPTASYGFYGNGMVAVGKGRVISTSNPSPGGIHGYNAITGALEWTAFVGIEFIAGPTVAAGKVYAGGHNPTTNTYGLYAVQASGTAVRGWSIPSLHAAIYSSPVVVGNIVYVSCTDANLYAFDADTGALVWSRLTEDAIYSSPSVVNGLVYVGSYNGTIYAINAATGAVVWIFRTGGDVTASPIVAGDKVFVGSASRNMYALDASSGHLVWSAPLAAKIYTGAAAANGRVYVAVDGNPGTIYALSAKTGAVEWKFLDAINSSFTAAHPIVANGVVYVGDLVGNLTALDAEDGSVLSTSIHANNQILGASISDGVLYFNDSNLTYAYSLPAGDSSVQRTEGAPNLSSLITDEQLQPAPGDQLKHTEPSVVEE